MHDKLPNPLLLQKLAEQNIMLLFNYYSFMGTKIFDYIAINRLILFCYTNDKEAVALKKKYYGVDDYENISNSLQADLIKETNSGYLIEDKNHLKKTLKLLYSEFQLNGK